MACENKCAFFHKILVLNFFDRWFVNEFVQFGAHICDTILKSKVKLLRWKMFRISANLFLSLEVMTSFTW